SLWLHGIPGAGKTILCSTIIESLQTRLLAYPLFYYFDFCNHKSQSVVNLLYSLLGQLSVTTVPPEIQSLYETCGCGTRDATISQLEDTVLSVVNRIASESRITYIVIDALDECADQKTLLRVLSALCQSCSLNVLVTSRQEKDISSVLE